MKNKVDTDDGNTQRKRAKLLQEPPCEPTVASTPLKVKGSTARPSKPGEFVTDAQGVSTMLAKYGVAVVHNVLTPTQIQTMRDLFWDALEEMSVNFTGKRDLKRSDVDIVPIKRDDPTTWQHIRELFPTHGMLIQNFLVGTAKVSTWLRCLPSVMEAYREFYGTNDLLSSMDGLSVVLPLEDRLKRTFDPWLWLHVDEAFKKNKKRQGRESVQSWVTAHDVGESDATLAVLVGSHVFFDEYPRVFGMPKEIKDFNQLRSLEEFQWYLDRGCELVRITCPAGAQVFWNSKTVHCGVGPVGGKQNNFRMVIYTCYTPRSWASKSSLKKKREMFEEGGTASHRADISRKFSALPRTYDDLEALERAKRVKPPQSMDLDNMRLIHLRLFGY